MKHAIVRAISIRFAVFLLTLTMSLALAFAHSVYLRRQAVLTEAAWNGNLPLMKAMYSLGVDVNEPACEYRFCLIPIVAAAWGGHNDAIRFLLDRGADVNAKPRFGTTALMAAAYYGRGATVRMLLSRGADVNADGDGETALTLAKGKGRLEIIELLRQAGARDKP
jgi:ankyrin repeat protein